jgi:hypothetical protein
MFISAIGLTFSNTLPNLKTVTSVFQAFRKLETQTDNIIPSYAGSTPGGSSRFSAS